MLLWFHFWESSSQDVSRRTRSSSRQIPPADNILKTFSQSSTGAAAHQIATVVDRRALPAD
jgi:hypothetical protein